MKQRLLALLAAGALLAVMVPAAVSAAATCYEADGYTANAACANLVTVTVQEGTSISVPAAFGMSGIPGARVQSAEQVVTWYSNETGKDIKASLADLTTGTSGPANTITSSHVSLNLDPDYTFGVSVIPFVNAAASSIKVSDISLEPVADNYHQDFKLELTIPSRAVDDYYGLLTFSAE